jgi:broad specificity phosphatase PhoE
VRPQRIFITRHGESIGNVNKEIYKTVPDYAVELTENGHRQANEVGKKISDIIGQDQTVQFYVSPFWRTRQTFLGIANHFKPENIRYYEDMRLREQEWGSQHLTGINWGAEKDRDAFGHTYYRFDDGESCADTFDRKSDFLGTMFRDFQKTDFPRNVVIVTHGMSSRVLIMRFFHATVEEFESWKNPKNCEYLLLERGEGERYKLVTPMKLHEVRHAYQFDWSKYPKFKYLGEPKVPYEKRVNENTVR